ncbi:MAG TPA: aminotransferase class IV, partial [bacterium]|nr:aminotransferase class IV [bacterium]
FRSFDGKIPFLNDHLGRLQWSSTFLGIEYPAEIDFSTVCQELIAKNNYQNARLKIVLSQTFADYSQATCAPTEIDTKVMTANVTIFCERLLDEALSGPDRLKVIRDFPNEHLPLVAIKTTNYLSKMRARLEAQESGFYDGILLNARGLVTETCTGNIFWIDKDSTLHTVMEEQGLLGGITKKNLIKLLTKHKMDVKQTVITPQELSHAKEVFITNSVVGVKPVVAIDDRQISGGEAGDITLMIMELWKKYLNELVDLS